VAAASATGGTVFETVSNWSLTVDRPTAWASTTVTGVLETVSEVAVTAVMSDRPLFAAVPNPDAVIHIPGMKPSATKSPVERSYPVAVADRAMLPVVRLAMTEVTTDVPLLAALVYPLAVTVPPTKKQSFRNEPAARE
jgi:hypothetical protein